MNIIKFKDTLTGNIWYNENLRGKYAYWIHCKYAVPFDQIPEHIEYLEYEREDDADIESSGLEYLNVLEESWVDIDWDKTNKIYDPSFFEAYNKFIPDDDITLEEIKRFRTYLAEVLLDFYRNAQLFKKNDPREHMLEYYAGGENDDIIEWLNVFGTTDTAYSIDIIGVNKCGCQTNSNLSSLYNSSLSVCKPIDVYKDNIKKEMIKFFSDIKTWIILPETTLNEIIEYLNGVLSYNLPLYNDQMNLDLYSCKCLSDGNTAQAVAQQIIRNLIEAFTKISDPKGIGREESIKGSKNDITRTLIDWSTNLYELMEWD